MRPTGDLIPSTSVDSRPTYLTVNPGTWIDRTEAPGRCTWIYLKYIGFLRGVIQYEPALSWTRHKWDQLFIALSFFLSLKSRDHVY